jgi:hypothetical protein
MYINQQYAQNTDTLNTFWRHFEQTVYDIKWGAGYKTHQLVHNSLRYTKNRTIFMTP